MFPRTQLSLIRLTKQGDFLGIGSPITSVVLLHSQPNRRQSTYSTLKPQFCQNWAICRRDCRPRFTQKASVHNVAGKNVDYLNYDKELISDFRKFTPPYVDPEVSYAHGRSNRELKNFTFGPLIEEHVREKPDQLAVVFSDDNVFKTYRELNEDIDRLVTGMASKAGLKRGDPIGLYAYNSYEALLIYYASNKLGLVLNPFNPSYKSYELDHVLAKSNIKCLFIPGVNSSQQALNTHWTHLCKSNYIAKLSSSSTDIDRENQIKLTDIVILDGQVPGKKDEQQGSKLDKIKIHSWTQMIAEKSDEMVRESMKQVTPDDTYCVYFTSGTTGQPKGAEITQFNAINCTSLATPRITIQRPYGLPPIEPKMCCPLPLFHAFAGILGALLPFVPGGGPILYTGAKYNIGSVVEAIQKHNCNSLYLTPTVLIDLLAHVEKNQIDKLENLKTICVGGSKIVPETMHKARRLLKGLEDFRVIYGSSENGVLATVQNCQESDESKLLSVGSPVDLTEVRIVEPQSESIKPLGEPGEVQTRGFNTMSGYLGEPERTREVITEGRWYKTGDMGTMDPSGNVQIVGRIKELIIKGGENVYPAEVESVLHQHDDIEDAQVFGVPDARFGEEVAVWIKLKEKSRAKEEEEEVLKENILNFCKSKLSYFKVPKYLLFVEDFPMTPVKKVKKFEMREKTVKLLNL